MMSTSPSEKALRSPHIIDKTTPHPLSVMLLGEVVGAHWMGDALVLYYTDGHKTLVRVNDDGDLTIREHEVPTC